MSLIEEALRKQREETEKAGTGHVALALTPPPIPESPSPDEGASEDASAEPVKRSLPLLIGLVVGGLIAVIVIIWLLFFGLHLWNTTPPPQAAARKPATTTPVVATNAGPTAGKTAAVPDAEPAVKTPPGAPAPGGTPVAPAVPPTSLEPASGKPPTPAPAAPAVTPPPAKPPVAVAKIFIPVAWPKLFITGIIGSTKSGHSAAIINGQMYSPGDSVEGVRIEAVEHQRIRLSFNGETRTVSIGAITE